MSIDPSKRYTASMETTLGTIVINGAFGRIHEFSVNCFVDRHIQNAIGGLSRQSHLNEIGQRTGLLRGREPLVFASLAQPPLTA